MSVGNIKNVSSPFNYHVALDNFKAVIKRFWETADGFNRIIQPLYFNECETKGKQLANLIQAPWASEHIVTALKILPLSLLIFSLSCWNPPAALAIAGVLTTVIMYTQKDILSEEGKKQLLLSCASAALLQTAWSVAIAVSSLSIGGIILSVGFGAFFTTGFYLASTLVKPEIKAENAPPKL